MKFIFAENKLQPEKSVHCALINDNYLIGKSNAGQKRQNLGDKNTFEMS